MCASNATLHIVHDLVHLPLLVRRGNSIAFHRFHPNPARSAIDQRWVLYLSLLHGRLRHWDCVFMVDLSDVIVVRLPACSALPRRLMLATDGSSPKVRSRLLSWARSSKLYDTAPEAVQLALEGKKHISMAAASSPALEWPAVAEEQDQASAKAHVEGQRGDGGSTGSLPVFNCGVVGGRRGIVLAALARVVERLLAHWRAQSQLPPLDPQARAWPYNPKKPYVEP